MCMLMDMPGSMMSSHSWGSTMASKVPRWMGGTDDDSDDEDAPVAAAALEDARPVAAPDEDPFGGAWPVAGVESGRPRPASSVGMMGLIGYERLFPPPGWALTGPPLAEEDEGVETDAGAADDDWVAAFDVDDEGPACSAGSGGGGGGGGGASASCDADEGKLERAGLTTAYCGSAQTL